MTDNNISDPVCRSFSQEQLVNLYRAFLVQQCGAPKDMPEDSRTEFHARVGLMVHFVGELFEFKP